MKRTWASSNCRHLDVDSFGLRGWRIRRKEENFLLLHMRKPINLVIKLKAPYQSIDLPLCTTDTVVTMVFKPVHWSAVLYWPAYPIVYNSSIATQLVCYLHFCTIPFFYISLEKYVSLMWSLINIWNCILWTCFVNVLASCQFKGIYMKHNPLGSGFLKCSKCHLICFLQSCWTESLAILIETLSQ